MTPRVASLLAALAWIGWFDPVPPWRGTGAIALAALGAWVGGTLGVGLGAAAVAPIVFAAFRAADPVGIALLAVGGLPMIRERQRGQIAAAVAVIGALELGRQLVAIEVLPGAVLGLRVVVELTLTVVLALGLPEGRSGAAIAAIGGVWAAAQGPRLAWHAATMALPDAAAEAEQRQSARAWDAVDARLDQATQPELTAVVETAPTRGPPGEQMARRFGIAAALDAGWTPASAVAADLASPLADALLERGRLQEGRAAVTRVKTPETAFYRSAIADLQGDAAGAARAWTEAEPPPGTLVGPGVIWETADQRGNFGEHALFGLSAPVEGLELEAVGQACEGTPILEIKVGSRPPVRAPVGTGPQWLPLPLAAGAYRLDVRWGNAHTATSCARNISAAKLTAGPPPEGVRQ